MTPKPDSLSADRARELLKAVGMRSTASRIAVLQWVAKSDSPVAHSDVASALVPDGYDKSTVYRCLVEMADANLLHRLDFGDHVWRFEYIAAEQGESGDHAHFVCVDCGKVACLPEMQIQMKPRPGEKSKMPGEVVDVMLRGHCTDCQ
jgi:Fur family ferric uptake transcriptional regulator